MLGHVGISRRIDALAAAEKVLTGAEAGRVTLAVCDVRERTNLNSSVVMPRALSLPAVYGA